MFISFLAVLFQVSLSQQTCVDASPSNLVFTSHNHKIYLNDEPFNLKGASWFGFEGGIYVVNGLWEVSWESLLDFLQTNGFNAMRLPYSAYQTKNNPDITDGIDYNVNPDLEGLTSLEIMDIIIQGAADRGIVVMLDMHCLEVDSNSNDGLWYDEQYPESEVLAIWDILVNRYKDQWNIIGLDVFNEPFDATWGTGNTATDFNLYAQRSGDHVHSENVSWLINVEGIAGDCTNGGCFWGENLQGVADNPVKLQLDNKVVYSPHCYGPSVFNMPYFSDPTFPNNMPPIWESHFGYIHNSTVTDAALVVGEWGGEYSGSDATWLEAFGSYLDSIDSPWSYFWCLNPNSGDTGGLLENDWKTPVTTKLNLLNQTEPNPTVLTVKNGQVCY